MTALTLVAPPAARPALPHRRRKGAASFVADLLAGADMAGPLEQHDGGSAAPEIDSPTTSPSPLLLLGRDDKDRPHASRFDACDADSVAHAAALMNMVVLPVTGGPLAELAAELPAGRLFASGKAFVPFASATLFNKLVSYTPIADRSALAPGGQRQAPAKGAKGGGKAEGDAPATAPSPEAPTVADAPVDAAPSGELIPGKPIKAGAFPNDWSEIRPLSIVLATIEGYDSWWPAEVMESKGDGLFVLKWVEGAHDLFLRRAEQLALLHPAFRGM